MPSKFTTVRVSRSTLSELKRFQSASEAKTVDETLPFLLESTRRVLIAQSYGSARGKWPYRPFGESDRLEIDR